MILGETHGTPIVHCNDNNSVKYHPIQDGVYKLEVEALTQFEQIGREGNSSAMYLLRSN